MEFKKDKAKKKTTKKKPIKKSKKVAFNSFNDD